LQDHDDRPAGAGRPSLLSPGAPADAQAETDRQRILSSLDDGAGRTAPARRGRPRARGWLWGGAAAVGAVAVALLAWVSAEEDEHVVPQAVHAAATAPADAGASAAVAPKPAVPAPAPMKPLEPAHASAEGAAANPLADMAPTPASASASAPAKAAARSHAHATAAADPLTRALENKQARSTPASRTPREPRHAAAAQAKQAPRTAPKPARQRAQSEPDSDVVLLAALIGHMEPRNRKATLAEKLETCKHYNAAGEAQCRARVCATAERKEPACKDVRGAGKAPDS
jgi:hypothetical protein